MKPLVNWAKYVPSMMGLMDTDPDKGVYTNILKSPHVGEIHTKPSETIPGMTLGLRELVDRYTIKDLREGKTGVAMFTPTYSHDLDIPDNLERLDVQDKLEMAREIRGTISDYQQQKSAEKPAEKPAKPAKKEEEEQPDDF
jgi:hypothetical protein